MRKSVLTALIVTFCTQMVCAAPSPNGIRLQPNQVIQLAQKNWRPPSISAVWIPHSHRILYTSLDSNFQPFISSFDLDTRARARLVDGSQPLVSPDGTKMLYLSSSTPSEKPKLWLANIDGSNPHELTLTIGTMLKSYPQYHFAWSTDSKRLAYVIGLPSPKNTSKNAPGVTAVVYPDAQFAIPQGNGITPYEVRVLDLATGVNTLAFYKPTGHIETLDWFDNNTLIYNFAWYLQNVKVSDEAAAQRSGVNTYSLLTHRERVILPPDYGWQATQEPVVDPSRHYVQFRDNGINDKWASAWYPFRRRMAVINLATRKVTNLTSAHDYPSCLGWLNNHELLAIMGDSTQKRLLQISVTGTRTQLALMPEQSDCPSVSSDEKYVLWTATDPYDITSAWIARTDGSGMHAVASLFEPLRGIATSRMTSVHWKSNDGLEIVGYLAYPLNYHPGKRYPTVVMLQGGPGPIAVNPDEFPGGVWFEQMLTARGYAVFRPDYREGGNYGFDKLLEARLGKLFEPSFNDIMSGVHSVEKLGVADPSHLYLMGHSYGSYTTNWLITHTHEFRAAVSYEGGDFFWEWGTYRGWNQSTTWTMRGTPLTRPEMYFANGPTFFASYMRTPTLFVVSENGIDSPAMAWLYAAERSLNINTEYILYKGEPHNIAQPANQLDLVNRILAWIKDN